MTVDELRYSITRFIIEVKKNNGEDFPTRTLYQIVICFQEYLETFDLNYKLLQDDEFTEVKRVLDCTMKERAKKGIGINRKHAQVIILQEADTLWQKGILGTDTPEKLLDTLFDVVGLNFAL